MKTLSVRQPWAWLIVHGLKDIENRTWKTKFRGKCLVHASKTVDNVGWERALSVEAIEKGRIIIPRIHSIEKGGIVGEIEIVDCVDHSGSNWYSGPYGFVIRNAKTLPFMACKGQLGFFDVDYKENKP